VCVPRTSEGISEAQVSPSFVRAITNPNFPKSVSGYFLIRKCDLGRVSFAGACRDISIRTEFCKKK
jgi:hypothetical protein